jgi:transposase
MQRRHFTDEFKREAVRLARQPGATKSAIARDLGIGVNLLARWQRDQDGTVAAVSSAKGGAVSPEEFERMRRELAKVKMERDILKKALGFFAADPK